MDVNPPHTATSQFIQAGSYKVALFSKIRRDESTIDDDDELDEDALPSFGAPSPTGPSAAADKGKQRAPDQLAPPVSSGQSSNTGISGNIGSGGTRARIL